MLVAQDRITYSYKGQLLKGYNPITQEKYDSLLRDARRLLGMEKCRKHYDEKTGETIWPEYIMPVKEGDVLFDYAWDLIHTEYPAVEI